MKQILLFIAFISSAVMSTAQNDPISMSYQRQFQQVGIPTYSTGGYKSLVRNNATGYMEQTVLAFLSAADSNVNGGYASKGYVDAAIPSWLNSGQFIFTPGPDPTLQIISESGQNWITFTIPEGGSSSPIINFHFFGEEHRIEFESIFHGSPIATIPGDGNYQFAKSTDIVQPGLFSASGTGSTSTFTFTVQNGLAGCMAQSTDAAVAQATSCSIAGTTMTVTTLTPPPLGSNNVEFFIIYK